MITSNPTTLGDDKFQRIQKLGGSVVGFNEGPWDQPATYIVFGDIVEGDHAVEGVEKAIELIDDITYLD